MILSDERGEKLKDMLKDPLSMLLLIFCTLSGTFQVSLVQL